jgi:hypothetical protein
MNKIPLKAIWVVLVLIMGVCRIAGSQYELCSDNPVCVQDHGKPTKPHGEQNCPNGHVCSCGHSLVIEALSIDGGFSIFQKSTTVYWDLAASSYEEPFRKIDYPPQLA